MSIFQYKKITLDALNKTDVSNKIDIWKVSVSDIKNNIQSLPKILSDEEVKRVSKNKIGVTGR